MKAKPDSIGCDGMTRRISNFSPQRAASGFTMTELLVVMATVALLATLVIPLTSRTIEKGRVAKVWSDLRQVEMGLEMYNDDYKRYPPVRVSCNTDEREHWCELPRELVELGYLPPTSQKGMSTSLEDPFNAGHTYKYAAPGPYYLNGQLQNEGFGLFVPNDFPVCQSDQGAYHDSPRSPLAWVVWSLGPRPQPTKALNHKAPVSASTWYRRTGDHGVLARIKPRKASAFNTL